MIYFVDDYNDDGDDNNDNDNDDDSDDGNDNDVMYLKNGLTNLERTFTIIS